MGRKRGQERQPLVAVAKGRRRRERPHLLAPFQESGRVLAASAEGRQGGAELLAEGEEVRRGGGRGRAGRVLAAGQEGLGGAGILAQVNTRISYSKRSKLDCSLIGFDADIGDALFQLCIHNSDRFKGIILSNQGEKKGRGSCILLPTRGRKEVRCLLLPARHQLQLRQRGAAPHEGGERGAGVLAAIKTVRQLCGRKCNLDFEFGHHATWHIFGSKSW